MLKNGKITIVFIALCAMAFVGCEKGDGDLDYGDKYIYIPQATTTGLNNHYPVPGGAGDYSSLNYVANEQTGTLDIFLGVLRSGKVTDAKGFNVDIVISADETNAAVASGEIANAMALPADIYELPSSVSIPDGKNMVTFDLSVDMDRLFDGSYDGRKLVLAVALANPSAYELSETNTSVVVIVDVDAVRAALAAE